MDAANTKDVEKKFRFKYSSTFLRAFEMSSIYSITSFI